MRKKARRTRALVLLSGGLDSMLAAKILQEQDIEVTGLSFVSCFFNAQAAAKAAKQLKIKLKVIDISDEHLAMVKQPRYGYGSSMNPCLDCHILMLKKAANIMKKENFDFAASGEVLGQRPMSQKRTDLELTAKASGLTGYLLRPLSAKSLEPTAAEQKGLVERSKLLDISGRSRQIQLKLAARWKISHPSPAGGCRLTEKEFGKKLKEMFVKWPRCDSRDAALLKYGRHFWLNRTKIVVGRNEDDNEQLEKLARKSDQVLKPARLPGATALIRKPKGNATQREIDRAKKLILKYSKKLQNKEDILIL